NKLGRTAPSRSCIVLAVRRTDAVVKRQVVHAHPIPVLGNGAKVAVRQAAIEQLADDRTALLIGKTRLGRLLVARPPLLGESIPETNRQVLAALAVFRRDIIHGKLSAFKGTRIRGSFA